MYACCNYQAANPRAAQAAPFFILPFAFLTVFFLTDENDYGHSEIVDTFETVEDVLAAIDLLEQHLDDGGPVYRLQDAISQLRDQLEDYHQAAESTES